MRKLILFTCLALSYSGVLAAEHSASPTIYQGVREAQQALEQQHYTQAQQGLKSLLAQAHSPYERALVQQNLGIVALRQQHLEQARHAFDAALQSQALPAAEQQRLRRIQAQLLLRTGEAAAAMRLLQAWRALAGTLQAEDCQLFAYAYTQLGQPSKAAWHWQQAIKQSQSPPLEWYQQLAAAYLAAQQIEPAIAAVRQLIQRQPQQAQYWLQLAQLYLKQQQNNQALATLQLAQHKGLLPADWLLLLVRLYMQQKQPLKAMRLLESAFVHQQLDKTPDNLALLAMARQQAREPALSR